MKQLFGDLNHTNSGVFEDEFLWGWVLKTCVEHGLLCLLRSFQNVSSAIKSGKRESTPLRLKTSKSLGCSHATKKTSWREKKKRWRSSGCHLKPKTWCVLTFGRNLMLISDFNFHLSDVFPLYVYTLTNAKAIEEIFVCRFGCCQRRGKRSWAYLMHSWLADKSITAIYLILLFFWQKCQTFAGLIFLNVRICSCSLSSMIVNKESLGLGLLVWQKKLSEDFTLGSD